MPNSGAICSNVLDDAPIELTTDRSALVLGARRILDRPVRSLFFLARRAFKSSMSPEVDVRSLVNSRRCFFFRADFFPFRPFSMTIAQRPPEGA